MNERKILRRLSKSPYRINLYQVLMERAVLQTADYVEKHLNTAMLFERTELLWDYAAKAAHLPEGLLLEFGVFQGSSINFFAERFHAEEIHGFDSFEGLAEDWTGYHLPKGTFDMQGSLPSVRQNVVLHKGWFNKTLPNFLKKNRYEIKFCHVDCDTHESSKYVLEQISPRLVPGSVIVFDEYHSYPNWQNGEFRARQAICKRKKIS